MQPFKQTESGYTATAKTVTFTGATDYDVAKLDNPVRARANAAIIAANWRGYRLAGGAV